jgi:hypothetical protein
MTSIGVLLNISRYSTKTHNWGFKYEIKNEVINNSNNNIDYFCK